MAFTTQQSTIEMKKNFEDWRFSNMKQTQEQNWHTYAIRGEIGERSSNRDIISSNSFSQAHNPPYFCGYSSSMSKVSSVSPPKGKPPDPPPLLSDSVPTRLSKYEFPKFDGTSLREWFHRCDKFFYLDHTPPELMVRLASLHMVGIALQWHQNFMRNNYNIFPSWLDYVIALSARFGEASRVVNNTTPYVRGWNVYGCANNTPPLLPEVPNHKPVTSNWPSGCVESNLVSIGSRNEDVYSSKSKSYFGCSEAENDNCEAEAVDHDVDNNVHLIDRDFEVSEVDKDDDCDGIEVEVDKDDDGNSMEVEANGKIAQELKADDNDVIEVEKEEKHAESKEEKSEKLFAYKDQNQDDEPLIEEVQNLALANESENKISDVYGHEGDTLALPIDGDDELVGAGKNEEDNVIGVEVHGNLIRVWKDDLESKKEEEEKHEEPKEEISDENKVCSKGVVTLKEGQRAESNFYVVKDVIKDEPVSGVDFSDFVELQHDFSNWDIEAYKLDEEFTKNASQKRIYQWVAKGTLKIAREDFNGIAIAYDQMGTKKIFTFGRLEEDTMTCGLMLHVQRSLVENKDFVSNKMENSYQIVIPSKSLFEKGKLVLVDQRLVMIKENPKVHIKVDSYVIIAEVRIWKPYEMYVMPSILFHPTAHKNIIFSRILKQRMMRNVWDLMTKNKKKWIAILEKHFSAASSIVVSNDGLILLGSARDKTVNLWDLYDFSYKTTMTTYEVLEALRTVSSGIPFAPFVRIDSLDVERIFNEPAADFSFGMTNKEGLFAVFDRGGGTLDVFVLDIDVKRLFLWRFTKLGSAKTSQEELTTEEVNKFGELDIDPTSITWRRVMEVNDWLLKKINIGQRLEGKEMTCEIYAASEIMFVLDFTASLSDVREKLGKMVIGKSKAGHPITTVNLSVRGALTVLVKAIARWLISSSLKSVALIIYIDGVFDLSYAGHVEILNRTRELGDFSLLGIHNNMSAHSKPVIYPLPHKMESTSWKVVPKIQGNNGTSSSQTKEIMIRLIEILPRLHQQVSSVSSLRTRMFSTREYCYRIVSV